MKAYKLKKENRDVYGVVYNMVIALERIGIKISPSDLRDAWTQYSDSLEQAWALRPSTDEPEEIFKCIEPYLELNYETISLQR